MSFYDAQNSSKPTPLDKNYVPENSTIVTPCQNQGIIRDGKNKKRVKVFFPPQNISNSQLIRSEN